MLNDNDKNIFLFQSRFLKQKDYWIRKLSGDIVPTGILFDFDNEQPLEVDDGKIEISFPVELAARVVKLSKGSNLSIYILLLAAFKILIFRYTANGEINIISPLDRLKVAKETINTLLFIRDQVEMGMTFKEVVLSLRQSVLEAYENQDYPYEMLLEYLFASTEQQNPRAISNIQCSLAGLHDARNIEIIKSPLSIHFVRDEDRLRCNVLYETPTYKKSEISRFAGHFLRLLAGVLENIEIRVADISILTEQEKKQLLVSFNDNKVRNPVNKTIVHFLREQEEGAPDRVNLCCQAEHITYRELNRRVDILAKILRDSGVREDQTVGILMARSPRLVESILSVWQACAAYLPIEPDYPGERIDYMLSDSQAKILLTTKNIAKVIEFDKEVIYLDSPQPPASLNLSEGRHPDFPASLPSNLAYVIYTSGSTGKPKGAMIEHRGMMNHIHAKIRDLRLTGDSILAQNASHTFDISVWQFFAALITGGKTFIYTDEVVLDPYRFIPLVMAAGVTILEVVPSYLSVMLDILKPGAKSWNTLQYLVVTGESLNRPLVKKWFDTFPGVKMVNAYGPTEAADDITHFIIVKMPDGDRIPIGKPIQNLDIYIVDEGMNLCPVGIKGEICAAGVGVGRGYLNKPELTHDKFKIKNEKLKIKNRNVALRAHLNAFDAAAAYHPPLTNHYKFYKTGDLGCWRVDGTIEFFGRKDHQVKIRGHRIELGEIESRLRQQEGIKEAAVVNRLSPGGDVYLCAYIIANPAFPNNAVNSESMKESLSKHLPEYMIPTFFVTLEKIPLTPNGKIDRDALPEPEAIGSRKHTPPRSQLERELARIWVIVLGIEPVDSSSLSAGIGIDDNFFQLGGHSLKATVLTARIHKELNVKLPLVELFKAPTIRGLSEYIRGKAGERYEAIRRVEEKEYYVLSSAQKRLYILQQMDLASTTYNMPEVIPLLEKVDVKKLEDTFKKLINRHESLRTSFHMIGDQPLQKVHPEVEFDLDRHDSHHPHDARDFIKRFIRPFDLAKPPLIRAGLIREEDKRCCLIVDMHHIISDGISHDVLANDVMYIYDAVDILPLRIQYKDFAQWENSEKIKKELKRQEEYWLKEFEGEIPVLDLPNDYPRPLMQSFEGNNVNFSISTEGTRALYAVALSEGSSLFMALLAVVNILLSKLSGQEEIIIGTPIAGRRHADLEKIIGMFVNTLPLRNYPAGDRTFREFLGDIKKRMLMVFENQEYPFEELVDKLSVKRDIGRNPLFDIMFVLQNMNTGPTGQEKDPESKTNRPVQPGFPKAKKYENIFQTAKFDLSIVAGERGRRLFLSFQYCTKLFKKETIERFSNYFKKIVSIAVKDKDMRISDIEIVSEEEKKRILFDFNNTEVDYPKDKTLHRLFEEQVEQRPNQVALLECKEEVRKLRSEEVKKKEASFGRISNAFGGLTAHDECAAPPVQPAPPVRQLSLTYRELNERSNRLAHVLIEKGVQPDTIVGLMMERSVDMIIGILGILKAGGAYLPIDTEPPHDRIDFMLKDSNAKILVTVPALAGEFEKLSIVNCQLNYSLERGKSSSTLTSTSTCQVSPANLAYVIYTSGSTGKPKGTMIEHRNVVCLMTNDKFRFDFNDRDVWTMFHSFCFDFSVWEMYGALLYGGKLIIIPRMKAKDTVDYLEILKIEAVTVLNQTPTAFYNLAHIENSYPQKRLKLRYAIFGGEALRSSRLKEWKEKYPETKLINMYGITETTVHVTYKEISNKEIESSISNIGKPIPALTVFVLDKNLKLTPIGAAGEMCVGGEGTCRGYLNKPELTLEKFVENPFKIGDKLYRSGDLARLDKNGELEYLGRIDDQVKIRGYRVELGEVESRLSGYRGIKEVVVLFRDSEEGDKHLCVYFVPGADDPVSVPAIREHLAAVLPPYMVPSYFVPLESMPLLVSGKIDRKALPIPDRSGIGTETLYVEPGTGLEKTIAAIWKKVLKLDRVGANDHFFSIGGNSFNILQVNTQLKKLNMREIPVAKMFRYTTIRELARYLEGDHRVENPVDEEEKLFQAIDKGKGKLKKRITRRKRSSA